MPPEKSRDEIAKENVEQSRKAEEAAAQALEADRRAGVPTNPAETISSVADSIKNKLARDEFSVAVDDETGEHVPARRPSTNS